MVTRTPPRAITRPEPYLSAIAPAKGCVMPHMSCAQAKARLIAAMPRPVEALSGLMKRACDCRKPKSSANTEASATISQICLRVMNGRSSAPRETSDPSPCHQTPSSSCAALLDAASAPYRPPLLDGHREQVGQPPLRISPCLGSQLAEHPVLRLGPQRPCAREDPSPPRCEPHRLDASVGVWHALDHTAPLEQAEAARQGRLVDDERVLQLPEVRLAHAREGREDAVLSHPQAARSQDVIVELCHCPADHAERIADAGGQPSAALSGGQAGAWSTHGRHA